MTQKLTLGLLCIVVWAAACTERPAARRVEEHALKTVTATQDLAQDIQADYNRRARAQLQQVSDQIDALQAQANEVSGHADAGVKARLAQLTAQRDDLRRKIDHLQDSSGDALTSLKAGIDGAMERLRQSADEARARLKR
jgi:hypothetical protein